MEPRKFKNNFNVDFSSESEEINNDISCTVPDQSLSVQDILKQYTSGQLESNSPLYSGDDVVPFIDDLSDLDLIDVRLKAALSKAEEENRLYMSRIDKSFDKIISKDVTDVNE